MAENTGIAWTQSTWNPVRGCTRASDGCRHCYAEKVAARFSGPGQPFHGYAERDRPGSKWTGKIDVAWHLIEQPLRWRRPRRIFANSMSDLFHPTLPLDELATIYAVMVAAVHLRGHTFQVLTKRPDHMCAALNDEAFWDQVNAEAGAHVMALCDPLNRRSDGARASLDEYGPDNPPPGIWLGVSVENQVEATRRIPHLLPTPAAVRFLSCEPLIGRVDLCEHLGIWWNQTQNRWIQDGPCDLHWVIVGGESGHGARPMHLEWAESLLRQCEAAGVPAFMKQTGSNRGPDWPPGITGKGDAPEQWPAHFRVQQFPDDAAMAARDVR